MLCLVLDGGAPLAAVEAALAGGVDWLQLRDRSREARPLYRRTRELLALAGRAPHPVKVLVNRRLDVAWAADADGAHLGYDALPVGEARRLLGDGAWLGVSAHGVEEIEAARAAGACYAHLAPIFPPLSKAADRPALGLEALRAAAGGATLPVLAQGGIEPANAARVVAAGAAGAAVTGAILGAAEPGEAARALRAALDSA